MSSAGAGKSFECEKVLKFVIKIGKMKKKSHYRFRAND